MDRVDLIVNVKPKNNRSRQVSCHLMMRSGEKHSRNESQVNTAEICIETKESSTSPVLLLSPALAFCQPSLRLYTDDPRRLATSGLQPTTSPSELALAEHAFASKPSKPLLAQASRRLSGPLSTSPPLDNPGGWETSQVPRHRHAAESVPSSHSFLTAAITNSLLFRQICGFFFSALLPHGPVCQAQKGPGKDIARQKCCNVISKPIQSKSE
ncbi:unnamed protein product [Protopolystoma xenopodis]|uniref:Uncharacterized protein n=1 Tax=Protopolystoma xenopodis TaxID=117903 RepID=A0A448XBE4_9PLAT|nr:unnamed protein product [Protopolystoma xenopodis]